METYAFLKRAREKGALAELFGDGAKPEVQAQGIGELGGTVLAQHAVSGTYDFILIAELPDAGAAGKVCIRCCARGIHTEALRAYSSEEAAAAVDKNPGKPVVKAVASGTLPIYVFLKRAREKGALAELFGDGANPEVQEQGIRKLGGTVLAQHAVSGTYDFILIAELPDAGAAGKVCIQCCARGIHTEALRAYSPAEAATAV